MDKNWSVPLILLDSLPATTSFLVAVSGGMDSVVLLDVLVKKGFNCQVAHCNFLLRGMESDEDAQFVQALANHYGLPFHSKPFQTREYAQAEGISLEMAARKLRYQWFEELRISQALDWIAIAHHQDDQIETMFLNLIRGSGIAGLTGMQLIQGKILRPLLNLPKVEIIRYCEEHGLNYRTDASNLDVSFKRNRIRHQLFPILETLNPSFRVNISETMARLADVEIQLKSEIEKVRQQIFEEDGNSFRLKLDELRKHPPTALYLFEMLRPFHFQGSIIQEMVRAMDGEAGRQFFSATHRITVDRDYLLIDPISSESDAMYLVDEGIAEIHQPVHLHFEKEDYNPMDSIILSKEEIKVDLHKIEFPLILRRWKPGDSMIPFGMKGRKKLSDLFTDLKMSRPDKEKQWLLCSGQDVVWVVGVKADDRFRISQSTQTLLHIRLLTETNNKR